MKINIKLERIKKNLTQQQLAEILNVSKQAVSEWERGNSIPRYSTLIKLKKLFNVESIDFLLEQEINDQPDGNLTKKTLHQNDSTEER